jgi:hypothetical protein
MNEAYLSLLMDSACISSPLYPLGGSASTNTKDTEPLFIGDESSLSPFMEVTKEVRKAAFLKDLEAITDFYGFKLIQYSKLAPWASKLGSSSSCTGGHLTCLYPSYAPDH